MTEEEVIAAAGPDSNPGAVGGPDPEACDEWHPARSPDGMLVMLEQGRLSRITLMRDADVRTPAGIGLGATAAEVRAAYPAAEVSAHKYMDSPAAYITVWAAGPETAEPRGIVYEVGLEGTVTHIHAGGPAIRYVEGCL